MSTWALVPLSPDSWLPSRHFPAPLPRAAPEQYRGPLVRLGDLAKFVAPAGELRPGELLVTPSGVSPQTGAVQPGEPSSPGAVFRLGQDLQDGDLLVPLVGNGPSVLISEGHAGVAFSRGFIALRPNDRAHSAVLWSILSSTSGLEAKLHLDSRSAVHRISVAALCDLLVPDPSAIAASVTTLLPDPGIDDTAAAPLMSRWRKVSLQTQSNWNLGPLLDPLERTEGMPVAELGNVRAGRLDPREYKDAPFFGGVAAFRPSEVGRLSTPRWWTEAEERDITKPESILLGALSLRVATSLAPVAVPQDVLVIDVCPRASLSAIEVRDRLVSYLGSPGGRRRLANHTSGAAMPRLTRKNLLELRVPLPEELPSAKPSSTELLSVRLETALWS